MSGNVSPQDNPAKDPDDWTTGDEPMTGPQRSYLQTLAREAGRDVDLDGISKADASRLIDELQAASAVGQGGLYRVYDELLREREITSAQVLLTFFDMSARTHYLNARQTLGKLLDWGAVPVINENDTTATDEISFGDNDFLAAQVAILLGADLLVILTSVDGLYSADPHADPSASLIERVEHSTDFDRPVDRALGFLDEMGIDDGNVPGDRQRYLIERL